MQLADVPSLVLQGFAVVWGLLWGSFANVVIYRLPRDMSVVRPRSHCPHCSHPIAAWHNVPVLSWLWLRGKTACCNRPIAIRYPIVEALGAMYAVAVLQLLVLPLAPDTSLTYAAAVFMVYFALGLGLMAAAFIDIDHLIVPDSISIGGIVLGLATFWMRPHTSVWMCIAAATAGFVLVWFVFGVLYRRLRGRTGMGLGDAKLLALAGAWFGFEGLAFTLFAGAVQGLVAAIVAAVVRGRVQESSAVEQQRREILAKIEAIDDEKQRADALASLADDPIFEPTGDGIGSMRVAFGPFLVLAILEYVLLGEAIVQGYRDMLWIA